MSDTPETPNIGSSPWVGSNGVPAHPTAPTGGGGPGNFVTGNRTTGGPGNDGDAVAHPLSPNGRHLLLGQNDVNALHEEGVQLDANVKITDNRKKPNPPKVEKAQTIKGASRTSSFEDIQVTIEILASTTSSSVTGAATKQKASNSSAESPGDVIVDKPGNVTAFGKWIDNPKKGEGTQPDSILVADSAARLKFRPTVTIQIVYNTDTDPSEFSAYGRGTTDDDKTANDTSVGFHEYRHVQDFITYYKDDKNLPKAFSGAFKTPLKTFQKAVEDWKNSFDDYFKKASKYSLDKTDNPSDANPTFNTYVIKHPEHKAHGEYP